MSLGIVTTNIRREGRDYVTNWVIKNMSIEQSAKCNNCVRHGDNSGDAVMFAEL